MNTAMHTAAALLLCAGAVAPAIAAEHTITLQGVTFSPAQLTIQAGDTVIWRNNGGLHNVVADDNSYRSGNPTGSLFTFTRVFNDPGQFGYFCEVHGGPGVGMAGRITVEEAPAGAFVINEGVQGSWLHPGHSSQGFFFDVSPSLNLFGIAWFTWTTTPGQYDWLTGAGSFANGGAQLTFQRSRGGVFNSDTPTTTTVAGTGTLSFQDCSHATLVYNLTDPARTGTVSLIRLLPASTQCTAVNPTPAAGAEDSAK